MGRSVELRLLVVTRDKRSQVADQAVRVFEQLAKEVVACSEFMRTEAECSLRMERVMHQFAVVSPLV